MSLKDTGEAEIKPMVDTVLMEHLTSREYFLPENRAPARILEDISLLIKQGETWAISGRTAVEVKLLLEIIANIRPYEGGRCVLAERGMMRRKRVILHHVFYIGSADMLYDNMSVLEYMMFAVRPHRKSSVFAQDELFEMLIGIGLGHISLTPVKMLTGAEKAVVTLAAAALSESILIILNLPDYDFGDMLIVPIRCLAEIIRHGGKTLVIGTNNYRLAEEACTHAAFLAEGRIIYQGTTEDLRLGYDPVELIVRGGSLAELAARLSSRLPGYDLEFKDDALLILNRTGGSGPDGFIHEKIIETGIVPESIEINPRTIRNAYEELLRRHDLQNRLLQEGNAPGLRGG